MKIKLTCSALLSLPVLVQAQTSIADWSFDAGGKQNPPYNSPVATSGVNGGIASVLGMNNSYYGGTNSIAYADVTKETGASVPGTSYAWRIRGATSTGTTGVANGWSTNAPIATQGAEFAASTAGFNNIKISFDTYVTTTGEANMAFEYTIDGINWNLAAISYTGANATVLNNISNPNIVMGNYLQITTGNNWLNGVSVDLSGISGVNNDPDFAIEMVNASTGADNIQAAGAPLNPTSGNWQLDNINITGIATPEPSSIALAGIGAVTGLLALRRNRKA